MERRIQGSNLYNQRIECFLALSIPFFTFNAYSDLINLEINYGNSYLFNSLYTFIRFCFLSFFLPLLTIETMQPGHVGQVETGHQAMIHDAQLDYYSRRLATCSSDRTIKIFNVVNKAGQQQLEAELGGHDGPVWQVQWGHPRFGTMLASCGYDAKVIVHREHQYGQWAPSYQFNHKGSVNAIAFAPHEYGLVLACASSDGAISVHTFGADSNWTVQTIQDTGLGVNSVSWAPVTALGGKDDNGKPVMRIVTGSCDNVAKIWKLEAGATEWTQENVFKMHTDWVRDVAWCPSTAVPTNTVASCGQDGMCIIWTQEKVDGEWTPQLLKKFSSGVWRVSWSLTGNILGVATGDNKTSLWKETVDKKWVELSEEQAAEPSAPEPQQANPGANGAPAPGGQ